MYLKRNKIIRGLPIPKKGTKYVARASSHLNAGVPVVIAVRDMLKLARNSKEVKHMINGKSIKLNGKVVKDLKESVRLFNILEVGKSYELRILPTGRFVFNETKSNERICKVVNKKIMPKGIIQFNLYDGTNVLSKEQINVGDSIVLDFSGKIKKIIEISKGKKIFVISGKSVGLEGMIKEVSKNDIIVNFDETGKEVELNKSHLIVL